MHDPRSETFTVAVQELLCHSGLEDGYAYGHAEAMLMLVLWFWLSSRC